MNESLSRIIAQELSVKAPSKVLSAITLLDEEEGIRCLCGPLPKREVTTVG